MAGKRIETEDLIDIPGYRAAIASAQRDYREFAEEAIKLTKEVKQAYAANVTELQNLRKVAAANGDDNKVINETIERSKVLSGQLANQRTVLEGLAKVEEQRNQIQTTVIARQKENLTLLESMTGSTARESQQRKRLTAEVVAEQIQLEKLNKTIRANTESSREVVGQYNRLQRELTEAKQQLRSMDNAWDSSTNKINKNNAEAVRLIATINRTDAALKAMDKDMGMAFRNVGNYQSVFQGLQGGMSSLLMTLGPVGIGLALAAEKAGQFIDNASKYEQLRGGLKAVTKDSQDYAHTQEQLEILADRLGISYAALIESYKGIKVGTEGTKLEGMEAERIFKAFTTRLAELKVPSDRAQSALKALSDMLSRGNITAEDLKDQLGQALPGSTKLFADAMGVSTKELQKMMQKGDLLAEDVLPKVATQLEKTFSGTAEENVTKIAGATERLTNQTGLLIDEFNQATGVTNFWAGMKNGLADTAQGLRELIKSNEWGVFFNAMLGGEEANARLDEVIARKKVVDEFASKLTPGQRQGRIDLLQEKIDKTTDQATLARYQETMRQLRKKQFELEVAERKSAQSTQAASDKELHEKRVARVVDDAKKLTLVQRNALITRYQQEAKIREEYNKKNAGKSDVADMIDFNKREIGYLNEFVKGIQVANKELEKKDAADIKRDAKAAQREAKQRQNEQELKAREALQNNLGKASANTGEQLALLDQNYAQQLVSERDYIIQKHNITVQGIIDRKALLHKAGKQETDDFANLNKELAKADTDYLKAKNDLQDKSFREALGRTKDALEADERLIKTNLKSRLAVLEEAYEKAVGVIDRDVASNKITDGEGDRRRSDLKIAYMESVTQATLAAYDTIETTDKKHIDKLKESAKTEVQIAEAAKVEKDNLRENEQAKLDALADGDVKREKEKETKKTNITKEEQAKRNAILDKAAEVAIAAVSGFADVTNAFREQDLQRLEKQKEYELSLVGDNEEAKLAINKRIAVQQAEIRRRQAVAERAAALFQIAISTAVNAVKIGIKDPVSLGLTIALGFIQAAVVAAKPLPEVPGYFRGKGENDNYEGPAWVAERGYELVESKHNGKSQFRLLAEKQLAYVNKNDRIYTHQETKRMLQSNAELAHQVRSAPGGSLYQPTVVTNGASKVEIYQAVAQALSEITWEQTRIDERGLREYTQKQNNRTEWLSKRMSYPRSGKG